ncbi:hypothetical protein ACS0TY_019242 [Phlomoides rotata]
MERMKCNTKWRKWTNECITTATMLVMVNRSPIKEFKLKRGLRQGDPVSPFLFLLVAEGLSAMTTRAAAMGDIAGAANGKDKVDITHLQYAEDTIFLCSGDPSYLRYIKYILRNFELLSGLSVNFHKSCIGGIHIDHRMMEETTGFLGCAVEQLPISYLGLQVGTTHWRSSAWVNLVARIRMRLAKWKDKNLSFGGRITLIQSVLSSIPTYYLSFYHFPKSVIKELTSIQRDFLGGF